MTETLPQMHPNGVEYQLFGDFGDSGIPRVAVIGGIGASVETHSALYAGLAAEGVAVLGMSAVMAKRYTTGGYQEAIEQVIDEQIHGGHLIAGISWGGPLAARYAADHHPSGLMLIGAGPLPWESAIKRRKPMSPDTAADILGGAPFTPKEEADSARLIAHREKVPPAAIRRQSIAMLGAMATDTLGRSLEEYAGPVLFACGRNDNTIRLSGVERLVEVRRARGLPVQLTVVDRGHGFTFASEQNMPKGLVARLARFARNHPNY